MSDRGEETCDCGNENRKDVRYRLEGLRRIINDVFLFLFSLLKRQSSRVLLLLFVLMIFFFAKEASSYFNSDCREHKKNSTEIGDKRKKTFARRTMPAISDFQHLILISVNPRGKRICTKVSQRAIISVCVRV